MSIVGEVVLKSCEMKKRIPYWNNHCPYGANSRLSVLLNSYCFLFQDRIEYQKFERERMHSRWTKVSWICFLSTACLSSDCQTLSYDIFSSSFFSQAFFNPIIVMPLFFIRQHDVCVDEKGVQDRWGVSLMNVKLKSILRFLSFLPPCWSIETKYENFVFTIN